MRLRFAIWMLRLMERDRSFSKAQRLDFRDAAQSLSDARKEATR